MSKLTAIHYRLFDGEETAVASARADEAHDFGGELVLTFEGGLKEFVSWVGEPVQYAIGTKDESHFAPDAGLTEFDVSATSTWAALIGREVTLGFAAADHQVLQISTADAQVLVCSFEHGAWWADALTVCKHLPATVPEAETGLPSPSEYLASTYPLTRKSAGVLGFAWLLLLALAAYAHYAPLSPWLEHGLAGLMAVVVIGGLALMLACAALVIDGRKRINDRVGLFLVWILVLPFIGVVIALLRRRT
jgi:hypothetical protein